MHLLLYSRTMSPALLLGLEERSLAIFGQAGATCFAYVNAKHSQVVQVRTRRSLMYIYIYQWVEISLNTPGDRLYYMLSFVQ